MIDFRYFDKNRYKETTLKKARAFYEKEGYRVSTFPPPNKIWDLVCHGPLDEIWVQVYNLSDPKRADAIEEIKGLPKKAHAEMVKFEEGDSAMPVSRRIWPKGNL